ncbi:1587_t:CDS:2, partial [Racocetra fulgida]
MYQLTKNNYHQNPKSSTVYTPASVSKFLNALLNKKIPTGLILDPCSDTNSTANLRADFLQLTYWDHEQPGLVLCNPPFNGYGHKLASE